MVLYAGENDIAGVKLSKKKSAQEVLETFDEFCETVHAELPETLIIFVSIKPPKRRASLWGEMEKSNRLVEGFARSDHRIRYVDVATNMLDAQGVPRDDLYRWDGLHISPPLYWAAGRRPVMNKLADDEDADKGMGLSRWYSFSVGHDAAWEGDNDDHKSPGSTDA